jgi:hypothetical protein
VLVEDLQPGDKYFVIVDGTQVKLAASAADAAGDQAIDINATNATGTEHGISVGFEQFDSKAAVDDDNETIEIVGHTFSDGDAVSYSSAGLSGITGLDEGVTYYVKVLDADHVQLASDSVLSAIIDITGTADSAIHRLYRMVIFDPSTAVHNANNTIDLGTGHGLSTGDVVVYSLGQSDDPIEKVDTVDLQDGATGHRPGQHGRDGQSAPVIYRWAVRPLGGCRQR